MKAENSDSGSAAGEGGSQMNKSNEEISWALVRYLLSQDEDESIASEDGDNEDIVKDKKDN